MTVTYLTSEGVVIPPMLVYTQGTEPTLDADHKMCIWVNSGDSNRVYLVFRRGTGDQVKVELT